MHEVDLLLELARQVLDVLLLPLQVHIYLLGLCTQASIFVARDVVLDL